MNRSSTGIQNPPLVPVDGDELDSDVDNALDALHHSAGAFQLSGPPNVSLGGTPPIKAEGGSTMEMSEGQHETPAPHLNWLISLGEG
jgi:hypothetical protein